MRDCVANCLRTVGSRSNLRSSHATDSAFSCRSERSGPLAEAGWWLFGSESTSMTVAGATLIVASNCVGWRSSSAGM